MTNHEPGLVDRLCNEECPCRVVSHIKPCFAYGIKNVPIRCLDDVIIDGTACGFSHVTRYVPKRINLGVSKLVISISQKSAPPYRVIIDLSIQYVCIVTAEGSMPMKN